MKILHITLILLFSMVLTSCEHLGIEVTTVKGDWQTEKTNRQYLIITISDFGLAQIYVYENDTIKSTLNRTWSLSNDTLSFYHQNLHGDGVDRLRIEQLSMNTFTLRNTESNNVWIMKRLYTTTQNDYDGHFYEVWSLKRDFWWYAWNILMFIMGGCLIYFLGSLLIVGVSKGATVLFKWIRNLIKNE